MKIGTALSLTAPFNSGRLIMWHATKKKPLRGKKTAPAECLSGRRGRCFFGSFLQPLHGGGMTLRICRISSDLDQKGAVLWSKSEMKHLKHPKHLKHLKHLKHCLWMFGLLFCQHFKELGGKVKDGVHKGQDQKGMLLVLGYEFFWGFVKKVVHLWRAVVPFALHPDFYLFI